jgi:hypothetical protein
MRRPVFVSPTVRFPWQRMGIVSPSNGSAMMGISAHRDHRFRQRDRAFRPNVIGRFGIVTAGFGDRDRRSAAA